MQTDSYGESKEQVLDRLAAEHRALKAQVHKLAGHVSLTSDEQFELARLKKLKLHTKDRLYTVRRS